jgi:DNA-binding IclR family transcriptional regulator
VQPPEDTDPELSSELHRIRRTGVVYRRGDYGRGLISVAATIDARAALGIVLPDKASPERYLPLAAASAATVRRSLD